MATHFRIGDLAKELEVPVETIRYYEHEGLLKAPPRSEGNYRLYTGEQRDLLRFVLNCRALDMTHEEIRKLLEIRAAPGDRCGPVAGVLDEHLGHVSERLRALRHLQAELKALRARCSSEDGDCGILKGIASRQNGTRMKSVGVHAKRRGT